MSVSMIDPLDILESQIAELEKRIIGSSKLSDKDEPIAESLVNTNVALSTAVSSYESISAVFNRIPELGAYLDPVYEDTVVDTVMKAKLILESEPDIRTMLNQLARLNELNGCLAPEPYKDIPALTDKLRHLSEQVVQSSVQFEDVESQKRKISEDFHQAMMTCDRAHRLIGRMLSQAEASSTVKKLDQHVD